jgi:hypothetical protein
MLITNSPLNPLWQPASLLSLRGRLAVSQTAVSETNSARKPAHIVSKRVGTLFRRRRQTVCP